MKKIHLEHFRAFKTNLTIDEFENKNLIICGENGAGKSSIFEGIKLAAYYQTIINKGVTTPADTPGYANALDTWIGRQYRNKSQMDDIVVKLDDLDFNHYTDNAHDVIYMIGPKDIQSSDTIILKQLLGNVFYPFDDVNAFLTSENIELILTNSNKVLEEVLFEKVKLSIEPEQMAEGILTLTDEVRDTSEHDGLLKCYNEAKLHLVLLTVLLESAKLHSVNIHNPKVLVLDDFITSLDSSNRTFLLNYIIDGFTDFQKVILTHNVSFFNLTKHILKKYHENQIANWCFKTLYEYDNDSYVYEYKPNDPEISQLLLDIKNYNGAEDAVIQSFGNKLRKRFELLTVELSRAFLFGDLSVSEEILEKLASPQSEIYLKKNPNNGFDSYYSALKEIKNLVNCPSTNHEEIRNKIKDVFEKYTDHNNLQVLRDTLTRLRLFQKVILHPMSHGLGNVTFTIKELKASAGLIEKMEKVVYNINNGLRGGNVNDVG